MDVPSIEEMNQQLSNNTKLIRRTCLQVGVGGIPIGGGAPIVIQAMTNTSTKDIEATTAQIQRLNQAGAQLVRLSVEDNQAAHAVYEIKMRLNDRECDAKLIGDFHYNGHLLLPKIPKLAESLVKYRINPGNVGNDRSRYQAIIETALEYGAAIRIGANWGSIDQKTPQGLVDACIRSAELAQSCGLSANRIILSAKVSSVVVLWQVYRELAKTKYALHLGLTEAGSGRAAIISTIAALAPLLADGIGDTIRISLTPAPDDDRCDEVYVAKELLQALGLASFHPQLISCPGCGRAESQFFYRFAQEIDQWLKKESDAWINKNPAIGTLKVAVMGCVINGPGEAKHADIGISFPGKGEHSHAIIFSDGQKDKTITDVDVETFKEEVRQYIKGRFAID